MAFLGFRVCVLSHKIEEVTISTELQAHKVSLGKLTLNDDWLVLLVGINLHNVGVTRELL